MYKISQTDLVKLLQTAYLTGALNLAWDENELNKFLEKLIQNWVNGES